MGTPCRSTQTQAHKSAACQSLCRSHHILNSCCSMLLHVLDALHMHQHAHQLLTKESFSSDTGGPCHDASWTTSMSSNQRCVDACRQMPQKHHRSVSGLLSRQCTGCHSNLSAKGSDARGLHDRSNETCQPAHTHHCSCDHAPEISRGLIKHVTGSSS